MPRPTTDQTDAPSRPRGAFSGRCLRWLSRLPPVVHGRGFWKGFTLIELLIVVAIVGILSAITAMGWSKVKDRLLGRGAAEEIRDAITLARADAMTRKRHAGVHLDPTGLRFRVFVDGPSA